VHVLVAGCGWLGLELARRLVARGEDVTGVRRDAARAAALAAEGIAPLALDLAAPDALREVPHVDAVIACQAAGGEDVAAYRAAYVVALRALLAVAARDGAKLVYTGSTGVLGQIGGEEVDERTPPTPASPTGEVLAEAEALIAAAAGGGADACLVRLSGLYGPGRTGVVERVRTGRLALGPGDDAWMNFCHRDDAASAVLAALARGAPGAVYHGSDASPARRREVVAWIAARLSIAPPRAGGPAGQPGGPGRALAPSAGRTPPPPPNRRISSAWTRATLGVTLAHPSFREGLGGVGSVPP
jgi:nucleoside-diphosphate-sugar epimerase